MKLRHLTSGPSLLFLTILILFGLTEAFLTYCQCIPLPICIPSMGGIAHFDDTENGYFSFSCNSLGYRERELEASKQKNEIRIAILGDSHAFGAGVEESQRVSKILEEKLGQKYESNTVSVFNFARPGVTYPDYLTQLKDALRYNPDAVVLIAFSGNDLIEYSSLPKENRENVNEEKESAATKIKRFLSSRFYLYHLLASASKLLSLKMKGENIASLKHSDNFGAAIQGLGQVRHFRIRQDELKAVLEDFDRYLSQMHKLSSEAGVKFAYINVPVKLQIDSDLGLWSQTARENLKEKLSEQDVSVDEVLAFYTKIHEESAQILCKNNIPSIDAVPLLKKNESNKIKYWPIDWHLNRSGHRAFADSLDQCLSIGDTQELSFSCLRQCPAP